LVRNLTYTILIMLMLTTPVYPAEPVAVLAYVTAVWDPYCRDTENACLALLKESSPQSFCPLAIHIGDEFYTSATEPLINHYQFQYIPAPVIDGSYDVKRGVDYETLQPLVEARLAEQRATALFIDGNISPNGETIDVSITISPEKPLSTKLTLIVFLREDNLFYGGATQQFVCRDLAIQEVTITEDLTPITIQFSFPLNPSWNTENLSVGAFLQDMDKPIEEYGIYQGAWDGNLR